MNGEAGEPGAADTAPTAQPSPSYCVTQHPLPRPTLPARLPPAAPSPHHPGCLAERDEASEHQAMHHSAPTLQVPGDELQDAGTPSPYFRAGQELKHTEQ